MLRRWIQMILDLVKKAKNVFINKSNTGVEADNVEDAIRVLKEYLASLDTDIDDINSDISTINTNLGKKQASITGGATTITDSNLTKNRVLISDANGKVAVSAVTSTELGYLDGVKSNIQTQLANKTTLKAYDKSTSAIEFSYAQHSTYNNPTMRINQGSAIEMIPNTGTYKIVKCEPYLYNNSVWKLKVSFYADGNVLDMYFSPD